MSADSDHSLAIATERQRKESLRASGYMGYRTRVKGNDNDNDDNDEREKVSCKLEISGLLRIVL